MSKKKSTDLKTIGNGHLDTNTIEVLRLLINS